MSTSISSYATPPPPVIGGGATAAQSPMQVGPSAMQGANGGGPAQQSPMQVPMVPSAVQGAAGGGALAQPAAPAPVAAPATSAQPAAPVSGGGGASPDMSAIMPALQQVISTLTALVTQLGSQVGGAQGQAGAAGVQGGGGEAAATPSGTSATPSSSPTASAPASTEGGGAPSNDPAQVPPSGCGCSHAKGAAQAVAQEPAQETKKAVDKKPAERTPEAPKIAGASDGKLNSEELTVKGKKMTPEQKRLAEIVLRKGKEMGANQKVLETAVATMIQESVIKNDSSVDGKDHDSLGLFQQRPTAGWGTREQISNPEYAAQKFFEKAIPNDKKNPGQAKTRLAQSVQISAFPDGYAKWDKEAEKIVADYLG